ncbi:MAG: NTP transferase domain-containing protein [Muribaculaceae bacterium]|nr:NTP transferase domain-containing protein [Muribaculaceae bacterium]
MNYAIIAAGEGSRLAQEGIAKPKPLVELQGEPMIGRLINIMLRCNPESISIIVNEHMTEVREYLESLELPVPLHLVVQTTPSSMHSLWHLSRVIPEGKFCLTTVDTIFREQDFKEYIQAFEQDETHDGMWAVTPFVDDEKPLWVEVDEQMNITAFRDKGWEGAKYVSGGVYSMTDNAFEVLDQCIEKGISRMRNFQRALIEAGHKLQAFSIEKIVDVDHAGDIATAEAFLQE